jgi:hypothetical protein
MCACDIRVEISYWASTNKTGITGAKNFVHVSAGNVPLFLGPLLPRDNVPSSPLYCSRIQALQGSKTEGDLHHPCATSYPTFT